LSAHNDITGDEIKTKGFSKSFEDNFDRIFRNKTDPLCQICGKVLNQVNECAWTNCPKWLEEWNEARIDTIGQNGPTGAHYGEEDGKDNT
jgi:hypothetical protein